MTAKPSGSEPRRTARRRDILAALALASASLLLSSLPVGGQEVVVFKDKRAEIVLGHQVEGAWTFLTVKDGQVGVPSDQIIEIRPATPEEIVTSVVKEPAAAGPAAPGEGSVQEPPAEPKGDAAPPARRIKDLRAQPAEAGKKGAPAETPGKLRNSVGRPTPAGKKKG